MEPVYRACIINITLTKTTRFHFKGLKEFPPWDYHNFFITDYAFQKVLTIHLLLKVNFSVTRIDSKTSKDISMI